MATQAIVWGLWVYSFDSCETVYEEEFWKVSEKNHNLVIVFVALAVIKFIKSQNIVCSNKDIFHGDLDLPLANSPCTKWQKFQNSMYL